MKQLGMFENKEKRLRVARAVGEAAAGKCSDKAERDTSFKYEAAREWVLEHLARHGATCGEDMVDGMKLAGIRGHDDRCFGPVFQQLAREGRILRYGTAPRVKGHGTNGATIWKLVRSDVAC